MKNLLNKIQIKTPSFFKNEKGATMVEYALMVSLIAVVAIAAVTLLGTNVTATFQTTADAIGASG